MAPPVDQCRGVVCKSRMCHQPAMCNSLTGQCEDAPRTNGTLCNDDSTATDQDTCQGGMCIGIDRCSDVVCAPRTCHSSSCANGYCTFTQHDNGASCDDGFDNTINDVCAAGECAGVDPCADVECTPSSQCKQSSCSNGSCFETNIADGASCEDTLGAATIDTCDAGVCHSTPTPPTIVLGAMMVKMANLSVPYGTDLLFQAGTDYGVTHEWTVGGAVVPAGANKLHLVVKYATSSYVVSIRTSNAGGSAVTEAAVVVAPAALTDTPPIGFLYLTVEVRISGLVDESKPTLPRC